MQCRDGVPSWAGNMFSDSRWVEHIRFILEVPWHVSQDSSVGKATSYGLDGLGTGVRFPAGARDFFLHIVQTDAGAYPAVYPMSTVGKATGT
jgi:hypothetical protein